MPLVERSGQGFITGGVIDDTPDWLGSYNEGVQAGQQQVQNRLSIQGERQRQANLGNEEARRAQRFGWEVEDRQATFDAASDSALPSAVPFNATPGPGLMDPLNIPAPRAPSPGLMQEGAASNQPTALSRDDFIKMLPEWAGYESQSGLPPGYLERVAMLESSNGTNFREGSQYIGVFQIGPQVAADFGVTPEQLKDPRVNAQVAAKLAARNLRQLREGLGREPQPWELYLAHQQGAGGALAILRSPNQSAVDALAVAYGGDRTKATEVITANGGNPQMTAGQFAQLWAEKYGATPFTGGPSQPGVSEVPVIPGLHSQATRPGRMGSETARLPFLPGDVPRRKVEPQGEQTVTGGKGSIPAGVTIPDEGQPPAPASAPGEPAVTGGAGLQTQPAFTPTGEVMPRVSQEEAGLTQPGQGSIASQIMRAPAGQPAAIPDTGMYLVEPAQITNDLRQLAAAKGLLERQYARAKRLRDFEAIAAIEQKALEINAAENLLQAMEVIARMQQGDDEQFAQALSGLTQGRQRLQPRSDGKFNVYFDGRLVNEGISREQIIASLRMQYDQRYQAIVTKRAERADEVEMKILESGLDTQKQLTVEEAKQWAQINIKQFEEKIKRDNPQHNITVNDDGTVTAVPIYGDPVPVRYVPEPVLDAYDQPMMNPDGTPKLKLVPQKVQR